MQTPKFDKVMRRTGGVVDPKVASAERASPAPDKVQAEETGAKPAAPDTSNAEASHAIGSQDE